MSRSASSTCTSCCAQVRLKNKFHLTIVATVPMTAGMSRADELVAALARERLWLTDAYYAGMTSYVQSLTAAAKVFSQASE